LRRIFARGQLAKNIIMLGYYSKALLLNQKSSEAKHRKNNLIKPQIR